MAFQEFAAFIEMETAPSVEWIEEHIVELRDKVTGDADAIDGKSGAFGDEDVDESEGDRISQSRLDDAGKKRVFEVVVVFFVAVKVHVLSEKVGKDFVLFVGVFRLDVAVALKVGADLCDSVLGDVAFDFPHGLTEPSFDAPRRGSEEGTKIRQNLRATSYELTLYKVGCFGVFVVQ